MRRRPSAALPDAFAADGLGSKFRVMPASCDPERLVSGRLGSSALKLRELAAARTYC